MPGLEAVHEAGGELVGLGVAQLVVEPQHAAAVGQHRAADLELGVEQLLPEVPGVDVHGLDREAIEVLNMWAEFIYAPLLEDRVRPIQALRNGSAGRELAGKVHGELKRIGGIRPPREFVLMDRAAVGLGSVFMHLGAEVNWHNLFHDLIDDFDRHKLAARQKEAAEKAGVPAELVQKVD